MKKQERLIKFMQAEQVRNSTTRIVKNLAAIDKMINRMVRK